jgi:Fusaric acid resistance protein-like
MRAEWLPAALRPTPAPWAVRPALWALAAAGLVAGAGLVTGDRTESGLAYFGVACAAVFVTSGSYRGRAISLTSQAIGAIGGIVLGVAVTRESLIVKVLAAAVVAMASGMVGRIGRSATAGALMAVIGLAFGQFGGVTMTGWEQGVWYLIGTLVVAVFALADWPQGRQPVPRTVRARDERLRAAAKVSTNRAARMAGLRLALCMSVATAASCALHEESHAFWLPLTVAVAVRPEYASVCARTINRAAGTAVGSVLAAGLIVALGSGWPMAIAAALSLGFAVLAGPKLYGLGVVGITCSALLSCSIGVADPSNPAIRLLDTALGCAIALLFGYLIWPERTTDQLSDVVTRPAATAPGHS